jgi:lysophospholipase L1-like esterase
MTKPLPLINLVFMGDSISFGQHIDPKHRWTTRIQQTLDALYKDTPLHIQFLNRGVSGETTRMGLARFAGDVQNASPDVMTLQFGLNDCNCWLTDRGLPRVSERSFTANLTEMIHRARWFGAEQVILCTNHRTLKQKVMLSGESFEAANQRFNELIREVATESGVVLCDIAAAFKPLSEADLARLLLPYPDALHLNVEGHKLYAQHIEPPIRMAVSQLAKKLGVGDR